MDYYYRKNIQGDVIAIHNASGTLVASYAYDAWGKCTILSGGNSTDSIANINPFRYRSYYYDTETGLYYLETRYYDPEIGRFISADSIEYLDPETIGGLNLFAYCNNNPVMYADPEGHFAVSALIIGALIGAAVGFAITLYKDYADDGEVFNGSISAADYVFNTAIGGLFGALTGGAASSTISIPMLSINMLSTGIGTVAAVGITTTTVSGLPLAVGIGLAGTLVLFSKPNSGRIRFSDNTGIDPNTGKEFTDPDKARKYYKTIKDSATKAKWKKWFKSKGWRQNHLK